MQGDVVASSSEAAAASDGFMPLSCEFVIGLTSDCPALAAHTSQTFALFALFVALSPSPASRARLALPFQFVALPTTRPFPLPTPLQPWRLHHTQLSHSLACLSRQSKPNPFFSLAVCRSPTTRPTRASALFLAASTFTAATLRSNRYRMSRSCPCSSRLLLHVHRHAAPTPPSRRLTPTSTGLQSPHLPDQLGHWRWCSGAATARRSYGTTWQDFSSEVDPLLRFARSMSEPEAGPTRDFDLSTIRHRRDRPRSTRYGHLEGYRRKRIPLPFPPRVRRPASVSWHPPRRRRRSLSRGAPAGAVSCR